MTGDIERPARAESLREIREFIEKACREAGMGEPAAFDLKLAVDEACSNIVEHGYAGMEPGAIRVAFDSDAERAAVTITDRGQAFAPGEAPAPDLDAGWKDMRIGGLGVGLGWHLIRKSVDRIAYERDPGGSNRLTLIKFLRVGKEDGSWKSGSKTGSM